MVAAYTLSPIALSTGRLSPVSADSFTAVWPSTTTPSTGMLSPGRTTKVSPICTAATGTSISSPFRTTVATWGARDIRLRRASVVLPLERASNIFPTVISARIMAADSKYSPWSFSMAKAVSPTCTAAHMAYTSHVLYRKAAAEPMDTSVSILGARWSTPFTPEMKNFWLITMTMADSSSSVRAMDRGLSARNDGSGQCHMVCPMEMYMSRTRNATDDTSRRTITGVSVSAKASCGGDCVMAGVSAGAAP